MQMLNSQGAFPVWICVYWHYNTCAIRWHQYTFSCPFHLFIKCKHYRSACILHRCMHAVRLFCTALHSTCSYHMMCCFGIAKTYRHHDALLQSHSASHAMVFLFPEGKGWLAPPLKTFHLAPERCSRASRAPLRVLPRKKHCFYFGLDVSKVRKTSVCHGLQKAKSDYESWSRTGVIFESACRYLLSALDYLVIDGLNIRILLSKLWYEKWKWLRRIRTHLAQEGIRTNVVACPYTTITRESWQEPSYDVKVKRHRVISKFRHAKECDCKAITCYSPPWALLRKKICYIDRDVSKVRKTSVCLRLEKGQSDYASWSRTEVIFESACRYLLSGLDYLVIDGLNIRIPLTKLRYEKWKWLRRTTSFLEVW